MIDNETNQIIEERAELISEAINEILEGRHRIGQIPNDYEDALRYVFAIKHRSISRYINTFENVFDSLYVSASSVEATIEDLVGIYGVYMPRGDNLLFTERQIIKELNACLESQLNKEH